MEKRARRVTRKPGSVRRSTPVDPGAIERLHAALGKIVIRHGDPDDADADTLRAQFSRIREARNRVQRIMGRLLPKLGQMNSDLSRVDAVIAAEGAELTLRGDLSLYKNEPQRRARLRQLLSEWWEAREEIRADLHLIEQAVTHAKWVREELRYAFEEASRSLASIELEQRLSR